MTKPNTELVKRIDDFYSLAPKYRTKERLIKAINQLIIDEKINELERCRQWCSGGQGCEYFELVDRIKSLKELREE
jgi:hypothetical protein